MNTWWISDDTRYSFKPIYDEKRLTGARRTQYGSQIETAYTKAVEEADAGLNRVHAESKDGSLYRPLLSPMMACEEAYLLGKYIRSIDPQAVLAARPGADGRTK